MALALPILGVDEIKTGNKSNVTLRNPTASFAASSPANAFRVASGLMGIVSHFATRNNSYQRAYNWELLLPDMGLLGMDAISSYCQDISFGQYNMQDLIRIRYGSEKRGYAGQFEVSSLKVKFLKPSPDIVQTYFDIWKSLMVDSKGFRYLKNNYAFTVYIKLYDTKGLESGSYRLTGVFPKTFPEHSLSYSADGLASYEIEFNVDKSYVW